LCSFPSINAYMAQVLLVGADLPTLLRATDSDLEAQFPWVPQRFLVRQPEAAVTTSLALNASWPGARAWLWPSAFMDCHPPSLSSINLLTNLPCTTTQSTCTLHVIVITDSLQ